MQGVLGRQTADTNQPCFPNKTLQMLPLSNCGSDFRGVMTTINYRETLQRLPTRGGSHAAHPKTQTGLRRRHDPRYQGQPISHFPPHPSIKQDDLPRHREGPLASPLQNLFLFNGLPCHPLRLISSSPACSPSPPRLAPSPATVSASRWQNATG